MPTYHVQVERSGKYWAVHVIEIDRWTQARHLREVDAMARDLVAIMDDVDPESIDLQVDIDKPDVVAKHLARVAELRREEHAARTRAGEELRAAARELRDSGMPLRDVGEVLDVSYQRVHQLVS